jgi:N-methylhydantoinase A
MTTRIGVDVGGTFTDLILFDEETGTVRVGKEASTPASPDVGVLNVVDGSAEHALGDTALFLHGTTVGLNALLERKGAVVGLLTTRGFRDVLAIRRSVRDDTYNLNWSPPPPLVPRGLRLEAGGRILADGSVDAPLDLDDVTAAAEAFVAAGVECVAVVFINSHANPEQELAAGEALREAGFTGEIALSHRVTGEYSEYERTSTTVVDAYVRPAVSGYFRRLESGLRDRSFTGECLVTRSGGGAMFFDEATGRPFETVMSGPVAGVAGAVALCAALGISQAVTADVGGTSFDTSLIIDGRPIVKYEGEVGGLPLQTPWIDVRSIGAGGGSIARAEAGLLRVGPASAGATPGPICYGRGGTAATVTDAAASLGMLGDGRLAGGLRLDLAAAREGITALGAELGLDPVQAGAGVITVAANAMAAAIEQITIEGGEDPRDSAIVAFGGAGPLFGCLLARELDIQTVVVPQAAGNFSAWGLLCEDVARSTARTFIRVLSDDVLTAVNDLLDALFGELATSAAGAGHELGAPVLEPALDLRYVGQEHTITLAPAAAAGRVSASADALRLQFADEHERHFGHRLELPVEVVNVRATVRVVLPTIATDASVVAADAQAEQTVEAYSFSLGRPTPFRLVDRVALTPGESFDGPAVITEDTTITYVDHGFRVDVHPTGTLFLVDAGA